MDIQDKDGNDLIRSFNGRVAKYFEESEQVLVTYNTRKQTSSDLEKLNNLLSGEYQYDMNGTELLISVSFGGYESAGGVLYMVSGVESLTEKDLNGSVLSDHEMLLFDVVKREAWQV